MTDSPVQSRTRSRALGFARGAAAGTLNITAILLLGLGLLAPLTPSEGMPSARDLVVFAAGPPLLLVAAIACARTKAARVLIAIECTFIVVLVVLLLKTLAETSME